MKDGVYHFEIEDQKHALLKDEVISYILSAISKKIRNRKKKEKVPELQETEKKNDEMED
jgi:hypothetical protein